MRLEEDKMALMGEMQQIQGENLELRQFIAHVPQNYFQENLSSEEEEEDTSKVFFELQQQMERQSESVREANRKYLVHKATVVDLL